MNKQKQAIIEDYNKKQIQKLKDIGITKIEYYFKKEDRNGWTEKIEEFDHQNFHILQIHKNKAKVLLR